MMYQPDLEDALDAACRRLDEVDVRQGCTVTAITQSADETRVAYVRDGVPRSVTARFVVGCDGGGSFTRGHLGIEEFDYGFSEPWMVCDFAFKRAVDLPMARQIGDPAAPTSIISIGLRHHRFSFMLDSADDFGEQSDPARVWQRVARYLGPDDADLIRVATYTFRSLIADQWRAGNVLLAGDAAHQMPPFLGQGMCSGIRDARNLAFKLDLLLRDAADPSILDTYQSEREPHVRTVTETGMMLGRRHTLPRPGGGGGTRPRDAPGPGFGDRPGQAAAARSGPGPAVQPAQPGRRAAVRARHRDVGRPSGAVRRRRWRAGSACWQMRRRPGRSPPTGSGSAWGTPACGWSSSYRTVRGTRRGARRRRSDVSANAGSRRRRYPGCGHRRDIPAVARGTGRRGDRGPSRFLRLRSGGRRGRDAGPRPRVARLDRPLAAVTASSRPPSIAMFLTNCVCWALRAAGSSTFQKACPATVVGISDPAMASAASRGHRPDASSRPEIAWIAPLPRTTMTSSAGSGSTRRSRASVSSACWTRAPGARNAS